MFCNEIAFVLQLVTCVRAVPGLLFTHIVLQWCALYHIWALGFLNQHFAKRVTITSATHKIHPCIICHSVMFYNENQLVHTARTQNETGTNWVVDGSCKCCFPLTWYIYIYVCVHHMDPLGCLKSMNSTMALTVSILPWLPWHGQHVPRLRVFPLFFYCFSFFFFFFFFFCFFFFFFFCFFVFVFFFFSFFFSSSSSSSPSSSFSSSSSSSSSSSASSASLASAYSSSFLVLLPLLITILLIPLPLSSFSSFSPPQFSASAASPCSSSPFFALSNETRYKRFRMFFFQKNMQPRWTSLLHDSSGRLLRADAASSPGRPLRMPNWVVLRSGRAPCGGPPQWSMFLWQQCQCQYQGSALQAIHAVSAKNVLLDQLQHNVEQHNARKSCELWQHNATREAPMHYHANTHGTQPHMWNSHVGACRHTCMKSAATGSMAASAWDVLLVHM